VVTVADWLTLWVASTKQEVSPKSHERYAEIVRCYLIPGLGGLALQRLTPSDIQRAYNSFSRNPSPRTRRHIHRILKSALTRAVEQQALARNPADVVKRLPKVERKPIAALTVEPPYDYHNRSHSPRSPILARAVARSSAVSLLPPSWTPQVP
jgi:hypothetical protein